MLVTSNSILDTSNPIVKYIFSCYTLFIIHNKIYPFPEESIMFDLNYLFDDKTGCELAATQYALKVPSGEGYLLGILQRPHGDAEERHPLVLLCHGFPGNEQNRDLAAALRNAGACAAFFHYRGCWGSGGDYRLAHLPEDGMTMLQHILNNAEKYHVDPERVYLVGHSMGGFCVMNMLAQGTPVKGALLMAPCDMGDKYLTHRESFDKLVANKTDYLRNGTAEAFTAECEANAEAWLFPNLAKKIDPALPLCFIGGEKDATTPVQYNIEPALQVLRERGMEPEYHLLPAGHSFDACRTRLIRQVADWIARQEAK